jgi:DNA-directed RNA polymerase specialized sigma24 family protein
MPLPDVAASLGIPVGTAKSRLHYSLAAMRATVLGQPALASAPVAGGHLA